MIFFFVRLNEWISHIRIWLTILALYHTPPIWANFFSF